MRQRPILVPVVLALFFAALYFSPFSPEDDSLSSSPAPGPAPAQEIRGVVRPGETMFDIFRKYGLDIGELFRIREASAGIHKLRDIASGQPYRIELAPDNAVLSLSYQIGPDAFLSVSREDPGFRAEKVPIAYETRTGTFGGTIESNLYDAMGGGDFAPLAFALSDIFSWDIDFATDLRKGDTFRLVVEELWLNGRFKRFGNILAAEFTNAGTTVRAFRYVEPDGVAGYYDEAGQSLQRAFLKAPLSYRRISSGFSHSRLHPILKVRRPHLAVDYVAPRGTPVSALGDGDVRFAGRKGPNGNLVVIRHAKGFTTYYGHLARIRAGIRRGARVAQGDVIGYVGATGRATGPHLDFRVKKGSRFVNPLATDVPRGRSIPGKLLADYEAARRPLAVALAAIVPAPGGKSPQRPEPAVAASR